MQTRWNDGVTIAVRSPVSLIVTAFAPVSDVNKTLTPELVKTDEPTRLLLIDIAQGKQRMAQSILAQVTQQVGSVQDVPDCDSAEVLKNAFDALQALRAAVGFGVSR